MYELLILRKAREDMEKSANWYNEQQEGVGERFLLEVIGAFRRIEANPLHYEAKFPKSFRFAGVNNFPYLVVFKVKQRTVIVNAVFHTSRSPKKFV